MNKTQDKICLYSSFIPHPSSLVLVLFGLVVLGCGKGEEMPPLYPVKGKVVNKGKAVQGRRVQFAPVKDQAVIFINGEVGDDGTFTLTTRKGSQSAPGAPEGIYHATYTPAGLGGAGDPKDPTKAQGVRPVTLAQTYKV